jgi:hypothetical protein
MRAFRLARNEKDSLQAEQVTFLKMRSDMLAVRFSHVPTLDVCNHRELCTS